MVPGPAGVVPQRYLQALVDTGIPVLTAPIGIAFIGALEPQWQALSATLNTELKKPYVNIVCAPPGLLMGSPMRASDMQMSPAERTELICDGLDVPPAPVEDVGGGDEIIYVPQTALTGLYTVGVPNIAITDTRPKPPDVHEIRALAQYDHVFAPSIADCAALCRLGVDAKFLSTNVEGWSGLLKRLEP